ncbi:MAG: TetR/AcrR family transcriptional regulator [Lachnospiraceae bacterium]|nr:TetR/AcrR family transcriptional regulator [Lachnospiraceae bacterium]
MSNNEANKVTKESICIALINIMEKKNFEEITISEIVRKAGVSRQSFYRNYDRKEDIIVEVEDAILSSFVESLNKPLFKKNPRLWLQEVFSFSANNRSLIETLHKANLMDVLFEKLPFIVEDKVKEHSTIMHYRIVGNIGALKATILEWVATGMKESSSEMADICINCGLGNDINIFG